MPKKKPFWETKKLAEMTPKEWESLCDGCGRCCIYVMHNEETDEVFETDIACKLFDVARRRCTDYANRMKKVKDCVQLTPENVGALKWMPPTCAYRRLAEGKKLLSWHPLVSGDKTSVVKAKIAVTPDLVSENDFKITNALLESRIVKAR
ncbi:MAG: YcgN family cysteine cluster protein [Parvularculaceae bacterium]